MEPTQQPVGNPNFPQNPNVPASPEVPRSDVEPSAAPAAAESQPSYSQGPAQQTPILPAAVPPPGQISATQPPVSAQSPSSTTASPSVANDVDVIEKEWVDQAQEIIKETQTDPYREEEAVESLQRDYLKKRYGHDVKMPDGQ